MNITVFVMGLYLMLAIAVGAWVDSDYPSAPAIHQTATPWH